MRSKVTIFLMIGAMLLVWPTGAGAETVLKISGVVNNPLGLTMADLEKFQPTDVRINDIDRDGEFRGVFECRGVSLKTLLTVAAIEKRETDFKKQVDLAVVVKSRTGKRITLPPRPSAVYRLSDPPVTITVVRTFQNFAIDPQNGEPTDKDSQPLNPAVEPPSDLRLQV